MAGINYFVISVLATDQFWDGMGFKGLGVAIKYRDYKSAESGIEEISGISRINCLEIRQMLEYS